MTRLTITSLTLLLLLIDILIIEIYFLIPAVIAKIYNLTTELAIPIGILSKEAKEEMGTHPVTTEARISSCSI